jgi:hypothetical protein
MNTMRPAARDWFGLPGEPARAEYELLRAHVLEHGRLPASLAAARFARRGLVGLIVWPSGEVAFCAELVGVRRPGWTAHVDPRLETLADVFAVLLDAADRLEGDELGWRGRRAR